MLMMLLVSVMLMHMLMPICLDGVTAAVESHAAVTLPTQALGIDLPHGTRNLPA